MSIASVSIKNPVFAWMLMAGFIIFGAIAFSRLPTGQYPDVDAPIINISATLEGASPEIMESDVVDVLEDAVMAVEGISDITSNSRQGSATITVEFNIERDIDLALQDVQARVSQAAKKLPKDMDPVAIQKVNPEENPIMWVSLSGTRSQQEISEYAKNILRDRFLTVEGNGDVMMGGYLERNMRIWVNPAALESNGLSADDVINALQREHVDMPGGRMESGQRESNVRIEGEALNVEQMGNLRIGTAGGKKTGAPVYLKDVALIEDGFEDRRRVARSGGFPAQGLGIIKQHGANTVKVAEAVHARIAELQKTLPAGLVLDVRVDNSLHIKEAVHEIELTLLLAVFLTAIVCWLFLGSLSSTLNVILAIPVSIFGTFAVMYFAGFSLNTFTLLALSLSVGIVVDDAVMVLENIYRHAEMGKDKVTAAREGTEQITFAALASTLAIIAIFLPVAFMTGIMGKFFFQFGVVLSVAVAISLLEALTLAPARCSQFLRVGTHTSLIERGANWLFTTLSAMYASTLRLLLTFRNRYAALVILVVLIPATSGLLWVTGWYAYAQFQAGAAPLLLAALATVLLVAAMFLIALFAFVRQPGRLPVLSLLSVFIAIAGFTGSLVLLKKLPQEMVPKQDQGFYMLRVTTPVGSTVDYTAAVMKTIEDVIENRPEIENSLIISGTGDVNSGLAFITLKPRNKRSISQQTSLEEMRAHFQKNPTPGTFIRFEDPSQANFGGSRRGATLVDFSIRGPDWDKLGDLADSFMEEMRASGVLVDVDTNFKKGMPEVQVIPNREKTLSHNVDIRKVAETVSVLVGGQRVGRYKQNGRRYDVRVRLLKDTRGSPEEIGNLFVRAEDGKLVRLSDICDIVVKPTLQSIARQNRQRAVSITANPAPGKAQDEALAKVRQIAAEKIPEGYDISFGGSSKQFQESRDSLLFALGMGIIVAYMILASQFNSFLHPVTILLALPFSISGALALLYLTNQSLNIYSMIGVILLMGIVKKNSILLVDYTNQVRELGRSRDEALIEACPVRLRPILMTTIATIAGALPGALLIGPGGELRVPMSMAVIGGLTVSTVLTLIVVPCFYSVVEEFKSALARALHLSSESAPEVTPAARKEPLHTAGD